MNRLIGVAIPVLVLASGALGCERREPADPHEFVAEETARVARSSPAASAPGAHVSCRCDEEGGLHVVAPAGSVVTVPPDAARTDAQADIVVASEPEELSEAPGTRLRHTVSLGFAGDGPLTDVHSQGYDDGGFYYPPQPYYGYGYGGSYRTGGGVHHGFVGSGPHGTFRGSASHGGFHGGVSHGSVGGGGSHGSHGGGGGHGGHGGR